MGSHWGFRAASLPSTLPQDALSQGEKDLIGVPNPAAHLTRSHTPETNQTCICPRQVPTGEKGDIWRSYRRKQGVEG